jgi:hypothetical protein
MRAHGANKRACVSAFVCAFTWRARARARACVRRWPCRRAPSRSSTSDPPPRPRPHPPPRPPPLRRRRRRLGRRPRRAGCRRGFVPARLSGTAAGPLAQLMYGPVGRVGGRGWDVDAAAGSVACTQITQPNDLPGRPHRSGSRPEPPACRPECNGPRTRRPAADGLLVTRTVHPLAVFF